MIVELKLRTSRKVISGLEAASAGPSGSLFAPHPLHPVVELLHVGVPLLPLPVEAFQQVGPLTAPPLLSVLQLPAELQGGAVTLSQQTQMLLTLLTQAPLRISLRFALRFATRFQLFREWNAFIPG